MKCFEVENHRFRYKCVFKITATSQICPYGRKEEKDFCKHLWTSDWQKIMFSLIHTLISTHTHMNIRCLLLIQTGTFGWKPRDGFESHQIIKAVQIWCSIKHKIYFAVIQWQYSGTGFSTFSISFLSPSLLNKKNRWREREWCKLLAQSPLQLIFRW